MLACGSYALSTSVVKTGGYYESVVRYVTILLAFYPSAALVSAILYTIQKSQQAYLCNQGESLSVSRLLTATRSPRLRFPPINAC